MSKVIESGCGNVTVLAGDEIENSIEVSDAAKKKVEELLSDESSESFLRIAVGGGGCAGFQYMFGLDDELEETDIINVWENGKVVVDHTSIEFMKGATLDFVEEFGGEYFSINNPHASSRCGCGTSFSYDMYEDMPGF